MEEFVTCCNISWFYSSVVLNLETESSLQVRIFLWGALSDLLPTMFNLMLKRAAVDSRCILCGSPSESVVHTLFAYEHAYKVWDLSPFSRYVCLVVFLLCGKYGTMYVQSFQQMNFICLFCL